MDFSKQYEAIRSNLNYLKMSHYLNDREFSNRIGINRATYSAIKKGTGKPSLDTLIKIVNAFDINLHDFVFTDMSKKSDMVDTSVKGVNDVLVNYGKRIEDLEDRIRNVEAKS